MALAHGKSLPSHPKNFWWLPWIGDGETEWVCQSSTKLFCYSIALLWSLQHPSGLSCFWEKKNHKFSCAVTLATKTTCCFVGFGVSGHLCFTHCQHSKICTFLPPRCKLRSIVAFGAKYVSLWNSYRVTRRGHAVDNFSCRDSGDNMFGTSNCTLPSPLPCNILRVSMMA